MKKLMFATALVASAAAFAAPINAISFEGYSADATVGNTADTPDASGGDNGMYFYFDGQGDGSLVKAFGNGEGQIAAPGITRPLYFASADPNAKYLELSTEGGILWRSINTVNSDNSGGETVYSLGDPAPIAATGTYLDTLVQFTPTEDGNAPEVDGADKLAIWLNVDSSGAAPVTNLMVKANLYDFGEAPSATATTFTLAPATGTKDIVAGEWYRLTIKAIPNVMNTDENGVIPAFEIYVDGVQMCATTAQFTQAMVTMLSEAGESGVLSEDAAAAIAANKLFPSLQEMGDQGDTPTLQGIGFKGSGALDDIVWTTEDPFDVPAAAFTLTWPAGVTPLTYSIDGGEPVALALGSTSPFSIPGGVAAGSTVAFTFTNADGVTKTMTAEATSSAGDIDAEDAVYVWADYLGDAVSGAYTIDDANDLDMLRKGVAAGLATTNETFKQTADINMSGVTAWPGIGTYAANLNNGVSFQGTYDGQDFTISNLDFSQRTYGGVFNQVKGGTIKNLTVDTITCSTINPSVADGEWGCAIVGNAGLGATLQNLVAQGSFGNATTPCSHNVAGIAVRVCGGASNVVDGVTMLETLVKDCTNNATLYGFYTKAAGITALTQDQNGVPNDYVLFDGCVNNSNIAMVEVAASATTVASTLSKIGRDGLGGILGYVADGTKIKDCVNTGTLTSALTTAKIGGIVGWAQGRTLDDLGGNTVPADQKMVGDPAGSTITGFQYATIADNKATSVLPPLTAGTTYLLEGNVAASETPVATLTAVGDTIAFDTALGYTFAGTVASSGAAGIPVASTSGTVTTYSAGYFPRTATVGQDGSAANPFEIADEDDLQALQAAVANNVGKNLAYVQVADIALTAAWPGIGGDAGKDKNAEEYEAAAFAGTYDGGNYTISNFQMVDDVDYGALFNTVLNATIKNLKISWGANKLCSNANASGGDTGASFVGTAKGSTLQNLTALAGTVTTVSASKDMAGIVGFLYAGTTVESCTNELNVASLKNTGRKCGGIAIISQSGSGTAVIRNCKNSGTVDAANKGGIIGYANVATEIDGCENTAAVQFMHVAGTPAITVSGVNKGHAGYASNDKSGGVDGLYFATVDGDVATFVSTNDFATGGSYKVMSAGATADFAFAAAGTIAFDTALFTPTWAVTAAEGLTLTDATSGTVKTYTAAGASGGYKVVIDGSDVAITPTAEDFAAMVAAVPGLDTNDVNAVNTALATEIGSTGIPAWQAAFLGLPPTEAGLASFKIESISFNEDGNVEVTLPDDVDPKTGRGVNITIKLMGSDDLSTWSFIENASGTTFGAVTPGSGETKKFYKVVVDFAGSSN